MTTARLVAECALDRPAHAARPARAGHHPLQSVASSSRRPAPAHRLPARRRRRPVDGTGDGGASRRHLPHLLPRSRLPGARTGLAEGDGRRRHRARRTAAQPARRPSQALLDLAAASSSCASRLPACTSWAPPGRWRCRHEWAARHRAAAGRRQWRPAGACRGDDRRGGDDAVVVDAKGKVVLRLTGYATTVLPGGPDDDLLAPLRRRWCRRQLATATRRDGR